MADRSRRKFLLFASQIGLVSMLGCDSCWPLPQIIFSDTSSTDFNIDEEKLKETIIKKLNSGRKLSVDWNCGGDEAILTIFQDGKQIPWESEFGTQLSIYLSNFLNLPDVGEFLLEGKGEILLENNVIVLKYESYLKGYQDYTQTGENLGWKEVNEFDEEHSGSKEILKK